MNRDQESAENTSMQLACHRCSWRGELANRYSCPICEGSLEVLHDFLPSGWTRPGVGVWRYEGALPVSSGTEQVTLGEGGTPLLQARRLEVSGTSGELLLKNETVNPTASFKDRPVTVATTMAQEMGLGGVVCASTGNAAVAVAAYAAQGGLVAVCLVPQSTPAAKLAQVEATGARVVRVRGNYSDAHFLARAAAERYGWANLTSTYVNPYMLEGDKTVAYELCEQLDGQIPDWIIVPVGAGPLLAAIYKGFEELRRAGLARGEGPKMVAVQAAGCSPIVRAFEQEGVVRAWDEPVDTKASSIDDPLRGYPEDGTRTLAVVQRSGGVAVAVTDAEIHDGMVDLARSEGLFVEPGAAATVAAYRNLAARGILNRGERSVLVLTGHGLKDPEALRASSGSDVEGPSVDAGDLEALGAVLEGEGGG